ncbi:MAG: pyridoxal-dependent decarboxylase [Gammaproteobacteria bacterium]|nr:pyridoxal-dependent decarboxylase [Gammaproteobacteria bacterium]
MDNNDKKRRRLPFDAGGEEFRRAGHALVDQIADFLDSVAQRPVTPADSPRRVRDLLGRGSLPQTGRPIGELLEEIAPKLFEHSLHNGHPRFMGYITSSGNPGGALGDLLAAAVNPNMARWDIAPLACEIEAQTVRWLAELIGYPTDCGGLMVSGGNMANFLAFIAARTDRANWDIRKEGLYGQPRRLSVYVSADAHTWVDKAADVTGLGSTAVRWVATDRQQRMRPGDLETLVRADRRAGLLPFLVVGTAGTTGTGAIDPLIDLAAIATREKLWFHVDGAYGAPAAALPDAPEDLQALHLADSVALDPHKWLYSPLEAACCLVRNDQALPDAFSFHPSFYQVARREEEGQPGLNYYNYGLQNSRGFRALKVWLGLQQLGRDGIVQTITDDIELTKQLQRVVGAHPELEPRTRSLSIATFRYRPAKLRATDERAQEYLNELNEKLLVELQRGGDAFISNAVVNGEYLLRACIVNFRTDLADVEALPGTVAAIGQRLDMELRPADLR